MLLIILMNMKTIFQHKNQTVKLRNNVCELPLGEMKGNSRNEN